MPIYEELTDPLSWRMQAALEGDPDVWARTNRALRDAITDHAVRHSPYYRQAVPVSSDFLEIPLLTKTLVRRHLEDLLARNVPEHRRVPKQTAGSTGEPLRFYRDSTQGPMEYLSARGVLKRLHGIRDDMAIVWISLLPPHALPDDPHPRSRPRPAWPRRGRRRFLVHPLSTQGLTRDRLRKETRAWSRVAPYSLYGYASTLAWMADEIASGAVDLPTPPDTIVTTGDTLTDQAASSIEEAFGAPIHSWYGSHEFNGYLAGTVPGESRYLFNPLLAHIEVLGDDGTPCGPGQMGRLVVTDLNNYAMPMLRYDTGDVAMEAADRWKGGWRLVEGIVGRSSEMLRLRGDRILTHMIVGQALFRLKDFHPHIRFYQCAQTAPDHLTLRVVWRRPPSAQLRRDAAAALEAVAGPETTIRVADVEELDRLPSGKVWILRREF